jgi:phage-related protein
MNPKGYVLFLIEGGVISLKIDAKRSTYKRNFYVCRFGIVRIYNENILGM